MSPSYNMPRTQGQGHKFWVKVMNSGSMSLAVMSDSITDLIDMVDRYPSYGMMVHRGGQTGVGGQAM